MVTLDTYQVDAAIDEIDAALRFLAEQGIETGFITLYSMRVLYRSIRSEIEDTNSAKFDGTMLAIDKAMSHDISLENMVKLIREFND